MSRTSTALQTAVATALALVCAAAPASAQGKLDAIKSSGTIQMGVALEPPYSLFKPDGSLSGGDPELIRAVFSEVAEVSLNANIVDWGALIPGLMASRFDIVATGLFIRPERCQAVLFSQPTLCSSEALIVREGNPKGLVSYAEIVSGDARVSTVAGNQEKRLLELGVPPSRIMVAPDVFGSVDLLKAGRVDVIAFPDVTLIEAMKQLPADEYDLLTGIAGEPIQCSAAAFNPQDRALRDFFDAGLEKLKASGKFDELLVSFGFDPTVTAKTDRTTLCGAEN